MLNALPAWWSRLWRRTRRPATSAKAKAKPAPRPTPDLPKRKPTLIVSRKSIEAIVGWEVDGQRGYESRYNRPTWPGGASGVTIGIGYDLGYNTPEQFHFDWAHEPDDVHTTLAPACGLKGASAREWLRLHPAARSIRIPWDSAIRVFNARTLPRFAGETLRAWPRANRLPPDAAGALLSIVYNRGASLSGSRRSEMRAIQLLLAQGYTPALLPKIAEQIESMKRLWVGKGLPGLLVRRDKEARLVREAARRYDQSELVCIYIPST